MTAPIVVFSVGNPDRGDDAIGPLVHGQLENWLKKQNLNTRIELIEDFQLNIEHALDLRGRALALFIDAGIGTPAPFQIRQIFRSTVPTHSSHALMPEAVLQVYFQIETTEPPPAFVLCIRGESFELGEKLTPQAHQGVHKAMTLLKHMMRKPSLADWEKRVTTALNVAPSAHTH